MKKDHEGWDVERYVKTYPDAPLYSEFAMAKMAEAKSDKTKAAKPAKPVLVSSDKSGNGTADFSVLYNLGDTPLAKRKNGTEMPCRVLNADTEFKAMIPDYNDAYIYDIETLKSVQMCMEMNEPCFAYGHSGLGKSSLFEQVCSKTNRPYVRQQLTVDTQESHIIGQWTVKTAIDVNGNASSYTEWQWGPLPLAMMNGHVYNADEFDRCPSSVTSCYQAVLEGKDLYVAEAPPEVRVVKPHPDFRFVATGNTNGTGDAHGIYQATMQMDAASMERFSVALEFTYMDKASEETMLMAASPVSPDHAEKIVKFATAVRDQFPENFDLTIGPRVMLKMAKIGIARGSFAKGVELCFANRLPPEQRKSALDAAQRIFGD